MTAPQSIQLTIHDPDGGDIITRARSRKDSDAVRTSAAPESLQGRRSAAKEPPINRFASPSCPWPWAGDTESDEAEDANSPLPGSRPPSPAPNHTFTTSNWRGYPEALFPNWTTSVVERCGIQAMIDAQWAVRCTIYSVDVMDGARVGNLQTVTHNVSTVGSELLPDPTNTIDTIEQLLETRLDDEHVRLRCLCVDELSGDVLQMLGSYYRIEPFYFSSAINGIPSRYHESFDPTGTRRGDHMYITLPFLRMTKDATFQPGRESDNQPEVIHAGVVEQGINVFEPLVLVSGDKKTRHTLKQDMLAVLLVRVVGQQTLITIHPDSAQDSARKLQKRIFMAGKGIYWGNLMRSVADPIFVLLIVMWSALYAWDEAMLVLYNHITYLETRVIKFTLEDMNLAPQLHAVRAHLLHYDELLEEFEMSLAFLGEVGISQHETDETTAAAAKKLLKKELSTLSLQVARLRRQRNMQDSRLNNVMKLVLSILNIKETQTSLQHGESMKQITYLTMIYLPASFIASVFGMNVAEIVPQTNGTLAHYFAATIPLAALTVWIAVGVSSRVEKRNAHMLRHIFWPFFAVWESIKAGCDFIVKGAYKAREKSRTPSEMLYQDGDPISRCSRTRSRGGRLGDLDIPMQRRNTSRSRIGRSTSQRRLTASQPDIAVAARDFA
ncbi:hypothetical protein EXIGLDRAFT_718560 [Exidia glandulosa HHB12029]|uniref:Cora-domain-containing protein n=1 Tax=Exidia glandulosa HHB12029 TaxID=1314781 RepID=A0A165HPR5_EXIGL|nr:hypothetical protein EXIGLDRAFT_718560 [Exidia glandulosa HHB12029]